MRRLLYSLREFGIDPLRFIRGLREIPWFLRGAVKFRRFKDVGKIQWAPVVQDHRNSSGSADGHYFWQDLICAKWIFSDNPAAHLDIGSRIDGFVAHLLVFRDVDVVDIRKPESSLPGLNTHVADAQKSFHLSGKKYPSVSSLHSLEHFGLGRYGDSLDPVGHVKGLNNISEQVAAGGLLYLSYPVGDDVVQFNAQRLLRWDWAPRILRDFDLLEVVLIPWRGTPEYNPSNEKLEASGEGDCVLLKLKRIN